MTQTLRTSLALAASLVCGGFYASAGTQAPAAVSQKDIVQTMDEVNFVETKQPGIVLSGYVDAGYTYNFVGMNDAIPDRAFTSDGVPEGDFNLNALKVVLEKPLSDENKLQAGFRTDIIMGEDAGDLGGNPAPGNVAYPNGSDSFYLQQAYGIVRLPWGNGLDVMVGKWQAIIGYEAEERPANINITPGVVSLIDPAWYIGVLAAYPVNDAVELKLGVGNGSGLDNGANLIENTDQVVITGAVGITNAAKNATTSVGFHYAPIGDTGYGSTENEPMVVLNWLGNWNPKFANEKLLLGFNTSFATFNDFSSPAPAAANDASSFYGAALYVKYQATDIISLAGRAEYAHTDDSQLLSPFGPVLSAGTNDIWTWTGTIGFDLTENLLLRAEYRIDYGDDVRVNTVTGATFDTAQMISTEVVFSF